jgi:anthranilate/para-aminobenzoate synthase component II
MDPNDKTIDDWQVLVNKPALSSDGKEVGIVRSVQPDNIIVSYGPVTPDKYLIPKSSIKNFTDGILYLADTSEIIDKNYKFE